MTDKKNKQYPGRKIVTEPFTANFVYVFNPSPFTKDPNAPLYSMTMTWNKGDPFLKTLQNLVDELMNERFGKDKWPTGRNLELPVRDGDEKIDWQGFSGTMFAVGKQTGKQPLVYDRKLKLITNPDEFYSGCIAKAELFAQAWEYGPKGGVSFFINKIQKREDGDQIGTRSDPAEVFGPPEEDDDDDFLD